MYSLGLLMDRYASRSNVHYGCIAADQERYTFADVRYGIDYRISASIL